MADMRRVGERIHLMRRRKGLTLKDLATRAETAYSGLSRLEKGLKPGVTFEVMIRVAQALDVSLDYLAGLQDEETNGADRALEG